METLAIRNLACGRCGKAFVCGTGGHDGGCWCMDEEFRVPMPQAAAQDCLCKACLQAYASSVSPERRK